MTDIALTSLFLQASLQDSERDYERSLKSPSFPHWDAVVITASDDRQAKGYRQQIGERKKNGRLPAVTEFFIVPDEGGVRVGSAGSSLAVIRMLREHFGTLENKKVLCLHAGGNSSRTPQYSALGKLFSPIPTLINGVPATLFDMFMVSMASVPGRLTDGILFLSGDVILLFNPLMCDFGSAKAAVISFKEDVETASHHGVYIRSESGNVKTFLHKQTPEVLRAKGAVDERNRCSIDTGALWLSPAVLERLYETVDTDEKYKAMVNPEARLSLYGDIAYCLSEDATLASLQTQTPEGKFCEALTRGREALWNAVGHFSVKLLTLSPARFVHFGSVPEIMRLMDTGVFEYESLGWRKQIDSSVPDPSVAAYSSIASKGAKVGKGCYLETAYVHSKAVIGDRCYLSFIDLHDETVPEGVLLHGLKLLGGQFVCRIMGVDDNPKKTSVFGVELETCGLDGLWDEGEVHTLWNAKLYPVCDTVREAVAAALNVYDLIAMGKGDLASWQKKPRKSLCTGFRDADPKAILDWENRMIEIVRLEKLKTAIREERPARKSADILREKELTDIQKQWVGRELDRLDPSRLPDFSYAIRLWYYLGVTLGDESYTAKCLKLIADVIMQTALKGLRYREDCRIVTDGVTVKLPLRVNWGGGWTDTCPYCNEHGGTVLNAAISLGNALPVEVRIHRIPEYKIVFDSRDMDVHKEFDSLAELQKTGNPFDPFALQKACLLACGVIPKEGGDLGEILHRLGGGFEMHSEVTNVPKGSGLGTSSILSAAAVKAVFRFVGVSCDDDLLYATVLAMEQIMSTGGGWQDQVGGVTPGIKLITSVPGMNQTLQVEQVKISEKTKKELNERFCVIYTGQRRLARNLLREVIGRYIGNEPDSLSAHREIRELAVRMKSALEKGDVDAFARLLDEHWRYSRMIDAGSTNTLIDQIFLSVDDLIDARMVCGAGGGGFLQVILKKGVTRQDVHLRLKDVFQDFAVDVWDASILYE